MEIVYFCCGIWGRSLGRGELGFVRRDGSNSVSVIFRVIGVDFVACELSGTTMYIQQNALAL